MTRWLELSTNRCTTQTQFPLLDLPCLFVCQAKGVVRLQGDRLWPCPEPLSCIPRGDTLGQVTGKAEVRGRWGWAGVFTCSTGEQKGRDYDVQQGERDLKMLSIFDRINIHASNIWLSDRSLSCETQRSSSLHHSRSKNNINGFPFLLLNGPRFVSWGLSQ